jgi:hypothetical protein
VSRLGTERKLLTLGEGEATLGLVEEEDRQLRLVGYVRESTAASDGDTAYAQSDRIRRAATDGGHALLAVCQDVPRPGVEQTRDGYLALLGVVDAGQVDGVVVASLRALSADMMMQEIMLWDLRGRGVAVLSADPAEVGALTQPPQDRSRIMMRELLARLDEYRTSLRRTAPPVAVAEPPREVTIELLPAKRQKSRS